MRISAVFEHDDGYRFEERFATKDSFRKRMRKLKNATLLHATDYTEGIAVRQSNLWGYLRS